MSIIDEKGARIICSIYLDMAHKDCITAFYSNQAGAKTAAIEKRNPAKCEATRGVLEKSVARSF